MIIPTPATHVALMSFLSGKGSMYGKLPAPLGTRMFAGGSPAATLFLLVGWFFRRS